MPSYPTVVTKTDLSADSNRQIASWGVPGQVTAPKPVAMPQAQPMAVPQPQPLPQARPMPQAQPLAAPQPITAGPDLSGDPSTWGTPGQQKPKPAAYSSYAPEGQGPATDDPMSWGTPGQTKQRQSAPAPSYEQPSSIPTTASISNPTGGGAEQAGLRGNIVNYAKQKYGDEGAAVVDAILETEGGLGGAAGDNGQSYGPLQFYRGGGQLNNLAKQLGVSDDQAASFVQANPEAAARWGIDNYLGQAISEGQRQGLKGADLATYVQRTGQVSVSPERAGQNYQKLYGSGGQGQNYDDPNAGSVYSPDLSGDPSGWGTPGQQQSESYPVSKQAQAKNLDLTPDQFGDSELSLAEASSACGPAAAVAFARSMGRNPTLREATDLAASVGWNQEQGMAGAASEKALLDKMGIPSELDPTADWKRITNAAYSGQPVAISTGAHYFVATGYDAETGAYFVGQSGKALKGGSEWMTREQIEARGAANGALYLSEKPQDPDSVGRYAESTQGFRAPEDTSYRDVQPSAFKAPDDYYDLDTSYRDVQPASQPIDTIKPESPNLIDRFLGIFGVKAGSGYVEEPPVAPTPDMTKEERLRRRDEILAQNDSTINIKLFHTDEEKNAPLPSYPNETLRPENVSPVPNMTLAPDLVAASSNASSGEDIAKEGVRLFNENQAESKLTEKAFLTLPDDRTPEEQAAFDNFQVNVGMMGEPVKLAGKVGAGAKAAAQLDVKMGDIITDGIARGRVVGEGTLTNRKWPVWKVELPNGEVSAMMKTDTDLRIVNTGRAEDMPNPPKTPETLASGGAGGAIPPSLPPSNGKLAATPIPPSLPPGGASRGAAANAIVNDSYFGPTPAAANVSTGQRLDDAWRTVKREMTDNLVDLKDAQKKAESAVGRPLNVDEQAYLYARLRPGSSMVGKQALQDHLRPALLEAADDQPKLSVYLTHQSNVEVATEMGKRAEQAALTAGKTPAEAAILRQKATSNRKFSGGLRMADSEAGLKQLEADLGPDRFATVERAAKQVDQAVEWSRKQLLDSGVWDKPTYDKLKAMYPHYVPTKVLDYMDEQAFVVASGKKIGLSDNQIKRLSEEGTERAREDPLASVERLVLQSAGAAAKNDAFTAFVKLRSISPELQQMIRPVSSSYKALASEAVMQGFEDGTLQRYVMPKDMAALVEQAPSGTGIGGKFNALMGVWRALITSKSIAFAVGQLPMDAMNYAIRESVNSGGPHKIPGIMLDYAKALPEAYSGILKGEYHGGAAELMRSGAGLFGNTSMTPKGAEEGLRALSRRNVFDIKTKADLLDAIKSTATLQPVAAVAERAEMVPRIASYKRAIRRGESSQEAALKARDLIDFSLGGNTSKVLNQFVPFFNVATQGMAMPYRAFRQNPKAFVGTAAALLAGPTLIAEAWNRQDEQTAADYDDIPQGVKDQGIIVMFPGEAPLDSKGNRHPQYALLRTREWSPTVIATREVAQRVIGKGTRGAGEILASAIGQMTPVQGSGSGIEGSSLASALSSVVPPGVKQGIEIGQNKNFYYGSMIATDRANENAGNVAKGIAKGLQDTGLSNNAQPAHVQYALSQLGGGPARMALNAELALEGRSGVTQAGPSGIPVIGEVARRFVRGDIGGNLEKAQNAGLPPDVQRSLKAGGVDYQLTPNRSTWSGIPLTMSEQAKYQELTNKYAGEGVRKLVASSSWGKLKPTDREEVVSSIVSGARDRAGAEVAKNMPAGEVKRRLASTAGGK